jgi:hypothetical protein
MRGRRRQPTASRKSPEWRKEAAVLFGAPVARGKANRGKWIECGLLVLLGNRGKEEEQARVRNTVTARWRLGGARVGVARAGEANGGDARAVLELGMTRGGDGSRRWRQGGAGVAVSGADGRRQRSRGQRRVPEEEEEGRGSEGPHYNLQKSQGLHCKQNFSTDPKL